MSFARSLFASALLVSCLSALPAPARGVAPASEGVVASAAAPLVIGETFTLRSAVLGEERRINVYRPPVYPDTARPPLPVLYMPDGGMAEDFQHVAGLVQVSVGNGTMRPFLLVGIENTERRRDMTGPTTDPEDRKIAPHVGGSAPFRRFLRTELMPEIRRRYATTGETAIVGESLAGLFVMETLLLEPDLFDTYLAFDPSLWWNHEQLLVAADSLLAAHPRDGRALFLASSGQPELSREAARMDSLLRVPGPGRPRHQYVPFPQETHATIYHPAALRGFRALLAPAAH